MKWKKRKREPNPKTPTKKQKPYPEDEDEDEDEEEDTAVEYDDTNDENEQTDSPAAAAAAVDPNTKQIEVLAGAALRISNFPMVVKHAVNRPHPSVFALVAAERDFYSRSQNPLNLPALENVSHGQLQVVSVIPADSHSLGAADQERSDGNSAAFVCTPPPLMEGKGVIKKFGNWGPHVVPMHADWFSPKTVHRLERQVVPHFFCGKSNDHTPERYMELRNRIVSKYLDNPGKRIGTADCQGLVMGIELHDINRIVRFLDHWGIINYLAVPMDFQPKPPGPVLSADVNGDLHVPSVALKSIDSLIHFDNPKSKYRLEDVYSPPSSRLAAGTLDLDGRIRERLSENHCNACSKALPDAYYQSQKEVEITLCSQCFHEGKFVVGHSSIDFFRVDPMKDFSDLDGDSWTDQETLLLLEALEIYNDNWNEIAEHVSTKTKAQCILHFIRLPMEDGLLENIDLPISSNVPNDVGNPSSNSNGYSEGFCQNLHDYEDRIPFSNSGNPVMALVAFLASAVGPRVAAACAHASLASLSKDDEHQQNEASVHGDRSSSDGSHREEEANLAPLSQEKVKAAAKTGLSAAAMKAKLFADHEEREIQRLAATIINHKLKRLELKLKQFAEVETVLMKECEQVESTRQRLFVERNRMVSTRLGQAAVQPANNTNANSLNPSNNRPPVNPATGGPINISAFSNNQPSNPHMPFMARQSMFPFGPRVPLSMIPSSSGSTSTGMYPSGLATAPSLSHPMLRPVSGTNTNLSQ